MRRVAEVSQQHMRCDSQFADLGGNLFRLLAAAVGVHDDIRTSPGEFQSDRSSNSTGSTGHNGLLTDQTAKHTVTSMP